MLIYDELMRQFDPKLVKMQFQVAVISLGFEAATYLKKYPGRFLSMHLADYSTADKTAVAVGSGVVDWKKLFAAAKSSRRAELLRRNGAERDETQLRLSAQAVVVYFFTSGVTRKLLIST